MVEDFPASVKIRCLLPLVVIINFVPKYPSSDFSCLESAGWAIWTNSEADVMLPASTIARKFL